MLSLVIHTGYEGSDIAEKYLTGVRGLCKFYSAMIADLSRTCPKQQPKWGPMNMVHKTKSPMIVCFIMFANVK